MTRVETCRHCTAEVVVKPTVTGDYRPFDRRLQPVADVPEPARYIPVQRSGATVMVVASDLPPGRVQGIRWVATRHTCAAGMRAWHEERERRRVASELAGMWGVPAATVLARWDLDDAEAHKDPDRHTAFQAELVRMHREVTQGDGPEPG